ncbi:MAG: membrane protein insertase YidC [Saccharofermentans sp.]|nr:membrane protein insertase YidC [Saccharofermentans sp.]
MNLFKALYLLFIYPLQLGFEILFDIAFRHIHNVGGAIICLSLVVNLLVLPMYMRADKIQNEQREIEKKLKPGIKHIKKAFSGDERFMMLQMYYRLNKYSPIMVLRSATSLLLQIPFFMAAYNMLSSLNLLKGSSFWFIKDLGSPDALLSMGTFSINVLPIIMTLINILSGVIYTRGQSFREKVQLNTMAILFLILLYNSPAGLTFYWTLNNVFSLLKIIVVWAYTRINILKIWLQTVIKMACSVSVITPDGGSVALFALAQLVIATLTGLLIPSAIIADSPIEFVNPFTFDGPSILLVYSYLTALGVFVVWFSIAYYMLPKKCRVVFFYVSLIMSCVFLINYFVSEKIFLLLKNGITGKLLYLCLLILIAYLLIVVYKHYRQVVRVILMGGLLVLLSMSVLNISKIRKEYATFVKPTNNEEISFKLSTSGENVVVIMMDRSLGYGFEKDFELLPELKDKFDGFVFYPNTISFGGHTNIASPALFGGYEYTPDMINSRSDESLASKQNEALKVMPMVFSEAGYDVTVIDPPLAGYTDIPNMTIYDDIDGVSAYYTGDAFNPNSDMYNAELLANRERNMFLYGVCASLVYSRDVFFDSGNYHNPNLMVQIEYNFASCAELNGEWYKSADCYYTLHSLTDMTEIVDDDSDNCLLFQNRLTHENVLKLYDLVDVNIDKEQFRNDVYAMPNYNQWTYWHFYSGGISLDVLAQWLDYLKESGVYDNTRIIIVSDHGFPVKYWDDSDMQDGYTTEFYNPAFMVKDFNSTGFIVSDEFMTNADTPVIAMDGIIQNPVNPYTGNPIVDSDKHSGIIRICASHEYFTNRNNGNVFDNQDGWYVITNTSDTRHTFNVENWTHYDK